MKRLVLVILCILFCACKEVNKEERQKESIQIAFLSDVHLLDIYPEFSDTNYKGILNPSTGKYTLARTMESQLNSTRLFNENYFAFKAALNDVVKRGIKYVVLPGDFSDDGQMVNVRGMKNILNEYSNKYEINFVLTTGNHDPVKPFYQDAGKPDFIGQGGKPQAIFSKKDLFNSEAENPLPVIVTKDIAKLGYREILKELGSFGFQVQPETMYWETPFTNYTYADYNYKEARLYSDIKFRTYKSQTNGAEIPDLSYLIEHKDNLWFLAIDANVYVPTSKGMSSNPEDFKGASIGYNNLLSHKSYLIDWIKTVTERAQVLGKHLVVFSHYPTVDFNDDASLEMRQLFGKEKMQLHRVPEEQVAKAFVQAGIKVHFGGHMHINDTGVRKYNDHKSLVNIQVPSLAAYIPAYKLLTIKDNYTWEVETIRLDSVPDFKTLFPLYEQEYEFIKKHDSKNIWNKDILSVATYKDFTEWHLHELVRLRFINNDWPENFKDQLIKASGSKLIDLAKREGGDFEKFTKNLNLKEIPISVFEEWTGLDMIHDFYKLKNADKLAISDVGEYRLKQYLILSAFFKSTSNEQLKLWGTIFIKICSGYPANHFEIDIKSGEIKAVNPLYW
ncbi:metallophosphoesterase [Aestuariibaculum suncheonense]|uniref:Metallophosphoesterase n=1 Tax=Aestuariibaculum suncheonense TaxID=1028745 RepID=A0A8J6QSE6_9FLAO|nr:metallophosphoesterase [Aestuariibaculum suncheonense]MBD0835074.1 metallophosphoesterase [Aestuariibaculum suncheonense]